MKLRLQNFLLFIAALAGAIWFFTIYPSQDVRSVIELDLSKKEVKKIATHQLHHLGYSIDDFTAVQILFLQDGFLLDSLQAELGRPQTPSFLVSDTTQNIKPYYWKVTFVKQNQPASKLSSSNQSIFESSETEISLWLDVKGRFIALENPDDLIPENKRHPREQLNNTLDAANYYLKRSGWKFSSFLVDTAVTNTVNSVNAVKVKYKLKKRVVGQRLTVDVLVTSKGQLLNFEVEYNETDQHGFEDGFVWALIIQIIIILFGMAVLILFYLRMRARVVDTRPAVIAAVIIGFVVAVYLALWVVGPVGLFSPGFSGPKIIILVSFGLLAAAACLLAFILFAVGDSLTRQYWPEKLHQYDYLQQGMVFNKPVGSILLKSVALAFVLAGLWTFLLFIFPELYFHPSNLFISQSASWGILRLLTHSIWAGFFTLLSIFLVIGVGIYNKQQRKEIAAIVVIIGSGLVGIPLFQIGPQWLIFLANAIFGLFLYLIFIKWDFLTLLLSYILFITLVGSTGGWIISGSPDLIMFIGVIVILMMITVIGISAIYFGPNEQELVDYVPEYVKVHADEDRIKQELQIAREVQQSFLPIKTPQNPHLDIAANCIPAYETGGDYYDFIELDENRVGVAIGDVSGKGIQAAFYMTFVKGLLHSLSHEMDSPADILKKANYFFYDNASKGTFISLIYGVIDVKEKTFTFARAGHNPILHLNITTDKVDELRPNGLGLGLTKDKIFDNKISEIKLSITENDLLLLYTDGITEALNTSHQFYGTDRLISVIKKYRNESATDLISTISNQVNSFIGTAKQHDDMTLMAIRLKDKKTLNEG